MHTQPAVVLFSGGLDSATVLAKALSEGFACHCLSFDYGQRHRAELTTGDTLATHLGASSRRVITIDLAQFGGSALTDPSMDVPQANSHTSGSIPLTYVPARNTVFLSLALAFAETIGAQDIFIGACQKDYSGYPDCRESFLTAFENMANLATKAAVIDNKKTRIHAPLLHLTKADAILIGTSLGIDYSMTTSCYQANEHGHACGQCDSCIIRRDGFLAAGIKDPTRYY